MSLFPRDGASLQHVRLHGDGGDALRARQRLERMLDEVDWSPAGLGPRALLFVRRIAVDARRGFAPRAEGGAFARHVSGALRERAKAARRPWLQRDAGRAEAVCFADEAELAACLWRDWVDGEAASHWWWGSVLKQRPAAQWLREQLFARGDRLVPAMALLAARGELRACIETLDAADAAVALRAVRLSHAIPALDAAASSPRPAAPEVTKAMSPRMMPSAPVADADRPRPPPSLRRLVETVPELRSFVAAPPARRLLAAALAVQRAPGWARSRAFLHALAELDAVPVAELDAAMADRPRDGAQPAGREEPVLVLSATQSGVSPMQASLAAQAPAPLPAARASRKRSPASRDGPPVASEAPRAASSQIDESPPGVDAPPRPQLPASETETPEAAPAQPARGRTTATAGTAEGVSTATLDTRYGGLFYLLNVALAWRIYGDFTMPRAPGISLSPWDLLAWTGRAWFGEGFEEDPLWSLLAELSGRELPARPGDDFDDAPEWTSPADAVVASTEEVTETHPGRRWLQHWRIAVEARLRSALGRDDASELLCRHRAGIAVSEAAVDVTLSLADLPLAVRFAGLDRDPGWIPAAGRSLLFHFV